MTGVVDAGSFCGAVCSDWWPWVRETPLSGGSVLTPLALFDYYTLYCPSGANKLGTGRMSPWWAFLLIDDGVVGVLIME